MEQHGFARNKIWAIDEEAPPLNYGDNNNKASVDLLLKPSEDDLKCWPHWYDDNHFDMVALNSMYELFGTVKCKRMSKITSALLTEIKGGCWLNSSWYVSLWKTFQMSMICQNLSMFQLFMMCTREMQLGNKLQKLLIF